MNPGSATGYESKIDNILFGKTLYCRIKKKNYS